MIDDSFVEQVEDLVGKAYEIGHVHGSNTWRQSQGESALLVNEGWGPCADEIIQLIRKRESMGKKIRVKELKKQGPYGLDAWTVWLEGGDLHVKGENVIIRPYGDIVVLEQERKPIPSPVLYGEGYNRPTK